MFASPIKFPKALMKVVGEAPEEFFYVCTLRFLKPRWNSRYIRNIFRVPSFLSASLHVLQSINLLETARPTIYQPTRIAFTETIKFPFLLCPLEIGVKLGCT